jgi:methylated-DNA-[protein]-cysteine S-methyltransferase
MPHGTPSKETPFAEIDSPLGGLLALADGAGRLTGLYFADAFRAPRVARGSRRADDRMLDVRRQLAAYFAGDLTRFDLALAVRGSRFQLRVWRALRAVPYGQTCSYGELARTLGDPRAARAVGSANARNPVSIVVPCHRLIGSRGELTGYAGGVERKQMLLDHEYAHRELAHAARKLPGAVCATGKDRRQRSE